jgi:hypothetical protein
MFKRYFNRLSRYILPWVAIWVAGGACTPRGGRVSADDVTRAQELAAIDDFIETYGVTPRAALCAEPTSAYVPVAIAAARLPALDVSPTDYADLLHRLLTCGAGAAEALPAR